MTVPRKTKGQLTCDSEERTDLEAKHIRVGKRNAGYKRDHHIGAIDNPGPGHILPKLPSTQNKPVKLVHAVAVMPAALDGYTEVRAPTTLGPSSGFSSVVYMIII
jgi:hypothetical protein